jgi:hypothetical protein
VLAVVFTGLEIDYPMGVVEGERDVAVGRLVVCIYRPHPRMVACVFALSILAYRTPVIYGGLIAAVADAKHAPIFAQELVATLLWMTCAWLGGLWQRQIDINSTKR